MNMMRVARIALLAGLVLAVSGCGASSQQGASDAAKIVPASAPALISVNTDLGSDQWKQVDELLQKFPGRADLLQELRSTLRENTSLDWEQDVEPALGDEIDLVWLDLADDGSNAVALTQPKDEDKFKALIDKGNASDDSGSDLVLGEVDGWTVISDSKAKIDRFEKEASDGAKLADDAKFQEAVGDLPDDSLAHAYVEGKTLAGLFGEFEGLNGQPIADEPGYLAAAIAAKNDGVLLVSTTTTQTAQAEAFESTLLGDVPDDAIAFATFKGSAQLVQLQSQPAFREALRELEREYGLDILPLLGLLRDEIAIYVRPQAPIPEITLLVKTDNEAAAMAAVDALMRKVSELQDVKPKIGSVEQDGVKMRAADFGEYVVFFGTFEGKLVVTNGEDAVAKLRESGSKLGDSDAFKEAKSAAGAPDETSGFAYVNLEDGIPLIERFAQVGGDPVPPEVRENLEPLKSLFLWNGTEESTEKTSVFLQID